MLMNVANLDLPTFLTNVSKNQGLSVRHLATFSNVQRQLATFERMFAKVFAKGSWRLLANVSDSICLEMFGTFC